MLDAIRWDPQLIDRYYCAGPRYTSYPTAVQLHDGVSEFEFLQALRDSRKALRPLSLYIHVPFCANICYFCTCNKVITQDRSRTQAYLHSLNSEIATTARHLSHQQRVQQLHFGGGSPTFLSHDDLRQLMQCLRQHFQLLNDDSGDYSIEIDPRETDWATMGLLRELGFNRISLSLQDLEPQVQRAINRLQSLEQTRSVLEAARTLQFRSVNIDLIYGLPKQTPESFTRTLDEVIKLQPDRLTLFNYAHSPERFMPQRRINSCDLPAPSAKLKMLHNSIEQLTAAGYRYIGMDHFALPDDELASAQEDGKLQRNVQGYTTHGDCDLLGLGVSAISQIGDFYSQNNSNLSQYQSSLDCGKLASQRGLHCNQDDRIRRAVIQQLLCTFYLDIPSIEKRFNIDFGAYFADRIPALEQMAHDRLLSLSPESIDILPAGRLLTRSVCMLFDRYLDQQNQKIFLESSEI